MLEGVLNDAPLRDKFQVVVSADSLARGKPAPEVEKQDFASLPARRLQVEPQRCACLEDSQNGILAGKAAGMKVIAVPDSRLPMRY